MSSRASATPTRRPVRTVGRLPLRRRARTRYSMRPRRAVRVRSRSISFRRRRHSAGTARTSVDDRPWARGANSGRGVGTALRRTLRQVLHGVTAPRLRETCAWLARNLPFVDHVALMGLENTGFALANQDLLWIDPLDYQADLAFAVDVLRAAGVNVSIYNLPLCLLDRSVWDVAVRSISDWKNGYLPECDVCAAQSRCAGFFSTGRSRRSRGIKPIWAANFGSVETST